MPRSDIAAERRHVKALLGNGRAECLFVERVTEHEALIADGFVLRRVAWSSIHDQVPASSPVASLGVGERCSWDRVHGPAGADLQAVIARYAPQAVPATWTRWLLTAGHESDVTVRCIALEHGGRVYTDVRRLADLDSDRYTFRGSSASNPILVYRDDVCIAVVMPASALEPEMPDFIARNTAPPANPEKTRKPGGRQETLMTTQDNQAVDRLSLWIVADYCDDNDIQAAVYPTEEQALRDKEDQNENHTEHGCTFSVKVQEHAIDIPALREALAAIGYDLTKRGAAPVAQIR